VVKLKKTVYLKQSRDALGRFGSVKKECIEISGNPGVDYDLSLIEKNGFEVIGSGKKDNPFKDIPIETKLTDDDHVYYHKNQVKEMVSKAFFAGLNSKTSIFWPSRLLERYLKENGF